jgi:DNA-directed RNA polymerase subunit RPC12/RpoP
MKEVLYRLEKYMCFECGMEFLVDHRYIKERFGELQDLDCPACGDIATAISATSDDMSEEFRDWGCAYPNGLTWEQEQEIMKRLGEDDG